MIKLEDALKRMEINYNSELLEQFEVYRRRILEWNRVVNLTAITELEDFEVKHFVDSVAICGDERTASAQSIIDVGTGAGFPGIPLAIIYPHKKFVLMDSLGKRMKIVGELAQEIGLSNVEVIHARAEELARKKEYREKFDLCVSRAVANLSVLSEYCIPFVKVGGWFVPYKTAAAEEEIRNSEKAVGLLGGKLISRTSFSDVDEFCQDGESTAHMILWINKIKTTVPKYPRKAGMPAKEPLK